MTDQRLIDTANYVTSLLDLAGVIVAEAMDQLQKTRPTEGEGEMKRNALTKELASTIQSVCCARSLIGSVEERPPIYDVDADVDTALQAIVDRLRQIAALAKGTE